MDPMLQTALVALIASGVVTVVVLLFVVLKVSPERRAQLASLAELAVPSLEQLAKKTATPFDDAVVAGLKEVAAQLNGRGLKPLSPGEELLVKGQIAAGLKKQEAVLATMSPQ